MKKSVLLIPLFATAIALPALLNSGKKESIAKVEATPHSELTINPFFFYDYDQSQNPGSFEGKDAKYWDNTHSFNSMGSFFRGESNEGWEGDLVSNEWDQVKQYVYFTWSAQNNSDFVNIEFVYGDFHATLKNDTFVGNTMMLHHFKIPDEQFETFDGKSFKMKVILHDHSSSDYAFNNFGYLHINQTKEDCANAMRYYLNHLDLNHREYGDLYKNILGHYYTNAYLRDVFLSPVEDISDGFESNDSFLDHWYLDHSYDNNNDTERHVDNVISDSEYRPDDNTNMPYNKTGNGFFKGWHQDGSGYVANDRAVYRFVSRPFVLSGNGLISIKMAGKGAALHVIDPETRKDLAWIDNRCTNFEGDMNIVATGFNTVTMVKHVINLEQYVGKTIQLAIADIHDEANADWSWESAYFDDLVVNYDSPYFYGVEEVEQNSGNEAGTTYAVYRDIYVNSAHIENDQNGIKYNSASNEVLPAEDTSAQKEAYDFLNYYFNNFRTSESFYSFCNVSSEIKNELLSQYKGLSNDALAIVDLSLDYDRGLDRTGNWYEKRMNQEYTVGQVIQYIDNKFGYTEPNVRSLLGFSSETSTRFTIIMIIFVTAIVIGLGSMIIVKNRRKANRK